MTLSTLPSDDARAWASVNMGQSSSQAEQKPNTPAPITELNQGYNNVSASQQLPEEEPILASDLLKTLKSRRNKEAEDSANELPNRLKDRRKRQSLESNLSDHSKPTSTIPQAPDLASDVVETVAILRSKRKSKSHHAAMDLIMDTRAVDGVQENNGVSPRPKQKGARRSRGSGGETNGIRLVTSELGKGPVELEEVVESQPAPEPKKPRGSTKSTPKSDDLLEQTRRIRDSIKAPADDDAAKIFNSANVRARGVQFELDNERSLNKPPDLRESGDFSQDEQELIRRFIVAYKHNHELSVSELVDLIQFTRPYQSHTSDLNVDVEAQRHFIAHSMAFWKDLYTVLPIRKGAKRTGTTMIQRFVRRRYHNSKRGGGWTEEEDDMLKSLFDAYPNQWKKISDTIADRSATDCRDRWRNYVQYGDSRRALKWSSEEEAHLERAVDDVIKKAKQGRRKEGLPELSEWTNMDINWQAVSEKMGGTRSRLQCSTKWKSMKNPTETKTPKKKTSRRSTHIDDIGVNSKSIESMIDKKSKPGFRDMLWGDKLDILDGIMRGDYQSEDDVDWTQVIAVSERPWPARACKAVLKELLSKVEKQETFEETLGTVLDWIGENHSDHVAERFEFLEEGAEHEDGQSSRPSQSPSNLAQKRKRKAKPYTPVKRYKSRNLVTASDEEC